MKLRGVAIQNCVQNSQENTWLISASIEIHVECNLKHTICVNCITVISLQDAKQTSTWICTFPMASRVMPCRESSMLREVLPSATISNLSIHTSATWLNGSIKVFKYLHLKHLHREHFRHLASMQVRPRTRWFNMRIQVHSYKLVPFCRWHCQTAECKPVVKSWVQGGSLLLPMLVVLNSDQPPA